MRNSTPSLVALFMPLFFGMMLGDISYGALLLAFTCYWRRIASGMLHDL